MLDLQASREGGAGVVQTQMCGLIKNYKGDLMFPQPGSEKDKRQQRHQSLTRRGKRMCLPSAQKGGQQCRPGVLSAGAGGPAAALPRWSPRESTAPGRQIKQLRQ